MSFKSIILSVRKVGLLILFCAAASTFSAGGKTQAADKFFVNKYNYTMDGIHNLLKTKNVEDSIYTIDCKGSWRILWPEIKKKNPWAMLAYAVDFRAPVQNQKKFKQISPIERAIFNSKNLIVNLYYIHFSDKKLLSEIENAFAGRNVRPSSLERIAGYSGVRDRNEFVEFANCIKLAKNQSSADICFHRLSKAENIMRFAEFIAYIDEAGIKSINDITCVR